MDLTNFYNLNPTELSAGVILFNLFFAFILQLIIVYIYKKTRHGLSYSQSFIFTLIIIGVLGTAIMMAVQHNIIGAFAIFGAFTLIRFRSILKETSDLAYVFFALVTGISTGMSHYSLAVITTLFLSIVIYLFYRFGFGSVSDNFDYILILHTESSFNINSLNPFFQQYIQSYELLHLKKYEDQKNEVSLSLRLKHSADIANINNYLNNIGAIKKFELLTGKNTSEF